MRAGPSPADGAFSAALRYDLEENKILRDAIGFGFDCDCFNFKLFYRKISPAMRTRLGRSVMFSIEFKSLGGEPSRPAPLSSQHA